jgi:hypothetical protein
MFSANIFDQMRYFKVRASILDEYVFADSTYNSKNGILIRKFSKK